jgi:RNA polymerase-binding protein DksA
MLTSIDSAKRRLEAERDKLIDDLNRMNGLPRVRTSPSNHPADNATDVSEKVLNSTLFQIQSRHLAMVEDALRRLEKGTYGICEKCGRPIDPARLEALPIAHLCVECKHRLEKPGTGRLHSTQIGG